MFLLDFFLRILIFASTIQQSRIRVSDEETKTGTTKAPYTAGLLFIPFSYIRWQTFRGDPKEVGVDDVMKPDYGEAVDIYEGEIPVFWPCGVTPQAAIENAKPPIVITHAPGHMFITDIPNAELNDYLEAKKK